MTDRRPRSDPRTHDDATTPQGGERRSPDGPHATSDHAPQRKEPNPLLREGPDAPDAADIEDPDEQL
jgi:hypothetical protein